jgi:hypothetical protein
MPWAFETKMGFVWATVITVVFILSIWAVVVTGNLAPVIVPIVAYFGFLGWVNRVK